MIILDASAAVELVLDLAKGEQIGEAMSGQQVHAPAVIEYEVLSALYGHIRGGLLSEEEGDAAFVDFEQIVIDLWPIGDPRFIFKHRHNFSAYDANYISLAEALQCPLITCDQKWLRAPAVHSAEIRVF